LPACVPDRLGAFAAVLCCGPAAAPPPQPCLHLARAACGRCLVWLTFKFSTLDLFRTSLGRVRRFVAQGFICFRPPSWPRPVGALGGGWASRVPGGLALVCGVAGGLRQGCLRPGHCLGSCYKVTGLAKANKPQSRRVGNCCKAFGLAAGTKLPPRRWLVVVDGG